MTGALIMKRTLRVNTKLRMGIRFRIKSASV